MLQRGVLVCFIALGLGWIALAGTETAHAADQVVNNCSNDTELRNDLATMQSSGGGMLSFNCGTATIVLTGGVLPTINSDTVVNGADKITISGNNSSRIFNVASGATLRLYNITLSNGYSSGDGGAIFNSGTLDVNSSRFFNNQTSSSFSGGAIVSYGSLFVVGSEFARNKAGSGGAIYPRFGAAQTTISASNLHHNETTNTSNGWGGAILIWDGAKVTLMSSTVADNKARLGGGVYVFGGSTLVAEGSSFYRNQATALSGGAIYTEGTATLNNSTLSANTAASSGGGLGNSYSYNLALTNVTISGNSANFGGGISNTKGKGNLTNVTITGNSATYNGGGIDNGTYGGEGLTLKNTIVANSTSGGNCHDTNAKTINSVGFNLSSDNTCAEFFDQGGDKNSTDPMLDDLAANGGATQTHQPLKGSPAIDAGTATGAPSTDQRGIPRPQGAAMDIGSVEVCSKPAKPTLYKPNNGKSLNKARVKLDWADVICAAQFKVQIRDGSKSGPVVWTGKIITKSEVKTLPLTKGKTYYWQVTAMGNGKAKSDWWSFSLK